MEPTNEISYKFCKIDGANISSHEVKFPDEPTWAHLCETIDGLFAITVRNNYELLYRTTESPRNLLSGQVTLEHMVKKLNDTTTVRRIVITPLRNPPSVQAPAIMKTSSLHSGQFVANRLDHNSYLHQVASQKNIAEHSNRQVLENPTDEQLIQWGKKNMPEFKEMFKTTDPSDKSQFTPRIIALLRLMYAESLKQWHKK